MILLLFLRGTCVCGNVGANKAQVLYRFRIFGTLARGAIHCVDSRQTTMHVHHNDGTVFALNFLYTKPITGPV